MMIKSKFILPSLLIFFLYPIIVNAETTPFKSVKWLQENLDREDLVLLHVGPEDRYLEKHIPGALLVERGDYTFSSKDETQVYDLPSVEQLKIFLESKGVDDEDTIVIYVGTNWVSPTTRLYFTLDYLGLGENTFLLDGGMALWEYEGGETTSEIPAISKGSVTLKPDPSLIIPIISMLDNLKKKSFNIVDARSPAFYEGVSESMGSKGHIPGAKTIPYSSIVKDGPNGSYILKSKEELQHMFVDQGLDKETPIVVYCHIGQQATLVYFASKIIGFQAKVFDGSMHEWSHGSDNPLEVD